MYKIKGFEELKKTIKEDLEKEIYLSSLSADIFVKPLAKEIDATYVAQTTVKKGNVPRMLLPLSPDERFFLTQKVINREGYDMKDVVYFGGTKDNNRFLNEVGVFVSSPLATPEIKEMADLKLGESRRGYSWLADKLKSTD